MKDVKFKGDYAFDIRPSQGYIQDAIVHAVYMPLTPSDIHRNQKAMIEYVLQFWRFRSLKLSEAKLKGFEKGLNLQYIRNCPPVACKLNFRPKRCARAQVCPFCWARRVVVPAAVSVFNGWYFDQAQLSMPTLDIYRAHYVVDFETVDEALAHAKKTRMYGVAKKGRQGGLVCIKVAPTEDAIRVATVALVATERGSVPESTEEVTIVSLGQLNAKQMAKNIGLATAISTYAARMEPTRVKEVVDACKGFRRLSTFGNLVGMNPKPPRRTNYVPPEC